MEYIFITIALIVFAILSYLIIKSNKELTDFCNRNIESNFRVLDELKQFKKEFKNDKSKD